jgi:hypothetical protein
MEYQCRDLTGLLCLVRLFHHLRALDFIGALSAAHGSTLFNLQPTLRVLPKKIFLWGPPLL